MFSTIIHDVRSIKIRDTWALRVNGERVYDKKIIIEIESGDRFDITMFASKREFLIIKEGG